MRKLHPGGLGQAQMQFLLKVLVHHVNHPVAESPEEKQRTDDDKGKEHISSVIRDEHAAQASPWGGLMLGQGIRKHFVRWW